MTGLVLLPATTRAGIVPASGVRSWHARAPDFERALLKRPREWLADCHVAEHQGDEHLVRGVSERISEVQFRWGHDEVAPLIFVKRASEQVERAAVDVPVQPAVKSSEISEHGCGRVDALEHCHEI